MCFLVPSHATCGNVTEQIPAHVTTRSTLDSAGPLNTHHLFIQNRALIPRAGADKRSEKQEPNSHYLASLLSVLTFPHGNVFPP